MTMILQELIESIEKASTSDLITHGKEWNAEIMTLLFGEPQLSGEYPKTLRWWNGGLGYSRPLPLLDSLGETMYLIPPKSGWTLHCIVGTSAVYYTSIIYSETSLCSKGVACTPAAALIAALLRLRLQTENQG